MHAKALIQTANTDRMLIERSAMKLVLPVARKLDSLAVVAYRDRMKPYEISAKLREHLDPMKAILARTMTAAHLQGRLRVIRRAASALADRKKAAGMFDGVLEWLTQRLDLDDDDVDRVTEMYGDNAATMTGEAHTLLEKKVQEAARDVVFDNLHVRPGVARMREAFRAAGVTPHNVYTLENLVRTQTSMAYSAGQWNADQDDAIQDILWGYQYRTMGDSRVREKHRELNEMTAEKDHECWEVCWPPCGHSCRCTILEIFEPREEWVPDNFEELVDEGWGFNPGQIFQDDLAA